MLSNANGILSKYAAGLASTIRDLNCYRIDVKTTFQENFKSIYFDLYAIIYNCISALKEAHTLI